MTLPDAARRARRSVIAAECVIVLALAAVWVTSESVRASKSLIVLFFYSFPSEFLVGLVPHEPALIFFGAHHPIWIVVLVATVGTVLAEALNYSVFSLVYEVPNVRALSDKKSVAKLMELFSRRPFAAILVAGFTPLPFFPVRLLVVMTKYPRRSYLWGVFLSRAPRFWILAALGAAFGIPVNFLGGLFVIMLVSVNIPALIRLLMASRAPAPAVSRRASPPPVAAPAPSTAEDPRPAAAG
jgi:membrane protein YqaA with SNARE-associated domain